MTVSPAKTAEQIEVLSGRWIRMGPKNHVLDGGPDTHTWRNFCGEKGQAHDMPAVNILKATQQRQHIE